MTTGEDRNKDRCKNWKLCSLLKLAFCHHGEIKLTQNCVCSTNPCINPFVPTSVTRKYHHKVLERLHVVQCNSAHLQNALPWASWETQYLNLFSADFHSCLVAYSRKPTKCVLKTLLRRSSHSVPSRPQNAKVHPAVLNRDTLVEASVTVYPSYVQPAARMWPSRRICAAQFTFWL